MEVTRSYRLGIVPSLPLFLLLLVRKKSYSGFFADGVLDTANCQVPEEVLGGLFIDWGPVAVHSGLGVS